MSHLSLNLHDFYLCLRQNALPPFTDEEILRAASLVAKAEIPPLPEILSSLRVIALMPQAPAAAATLIVGYPNHAALDAGPLFNSWREIEKGLRQDTDELDLYESTIFNMKVAYVLGLQQAIEYLVGTLLPLPAEEGKELLEKQCLDLQTWQSPENLHPLLEKAREIDHHRDMLRRLRDLPAPPTTH